MSKISEWNKFLKVRVVKEINAIRAKGIMLEDVKEYLIEELQLRHCGSYRSEEATGHYESYWFNDAGVRMAWAAARTWIPTLVVSFATKEEWKILREKLISKGFVRPSVQKESPLSSRGLFRGDTGVDADYDY